MKLNSHDHKVRQINTQLSLHIYLSLWKYFINSTAKVSSSVLIN